VTTLTLRARGAAPAGEVWDRYVRPARWPQWSPQIRQVRSSTPRLEAGTTGTVIGPLGIRVAFEVTSVEEATRRWSWRARLGPITLLLAHVVEADGEATSTTLRLSGPFPVVVAYAPLAQLALSRLVTTGRGSAVS
jgi:hypothetical protein